MYFWLLTGVISVVQIQATEQLDVQACVDIAIRQSAKIEEAEAKVQEFRARLQEIESVYYPKLWGKAFIAPTFTIKGDGFTENVERHWKSISDWGPYSSLEITLAQPLYTFGRAEAGKQAAQARLEVERARLEAASQQVALETRKMYYTVLYAQSMLPALRQAEKILNQALQKAQEGFDEGSGDVTQVDLAKLTFGSAELQRHILTAQDGAKLAMMALKHTMGLDAQAPLVLAQAQLPKPPDVLELASASDLVAQANRTRPEWIQLEQGKRATAKWAQAERLAVWPTLFAAGLFQGAYTPTHDNKDHNPWHLDIYNRTAGGIALGLKFDLDPALARAKANIAKASGEQVQALQRLAQTGIALQVRKAYDDTQRHHQVAQIAHKGMVATKQWLQFAASGYASGVGEPKDILEGMVAYLQAKRTYLETVQAYWTAQAELNHALGRT